MNEPKTQNLGLNKIDRSSPSTTYFDLDKYLDQNWEKVDEGVGQVEEKAEETAAQVSSIQERLDTEKRRSVTLEPGMQIINAERASGFKLEGLNGRTLVNLLGRDGNFESAARWLLFQGAASIDPANKTEGSNGIKLTVTSGAFATATAVNTINAKANKFYIAVVDAKNGNATNASFYCNGLTATKGVNVTSDTTKFVPLWRAYAPTSDVVASVIVQTNSSATGQYAYFDAVRFYEITAAEYATLDSMTPEQVAAKYPYVDSVQPVSNPYAIRYGENLLPPFYEWEKNNTFSMSSEYEGVLKNTVGDDIKCSIPFKIGERYTYLAEHTGVIGVNAWAADGSLIGGESLVGYTREQFVTFTIPVDTARLNIYFANLATETQILPEVTIKNPMILIGSTSKPFKPREDSMFALQADLYADPVTGENTDEVLERDGQYFKLAKWGHVIVNDKFTYEKLAGTEVGYKQVYVPSLISPLPVTNGAFMTKYDGKILTRVEGNKTTADLFGIHSNAGTLYVTISNTDSGWGDSYTPSADEIKAYFLGWKMFLGGQGNVSKPYNGEAAGKAWCPLDSIYQSGTAATHYSTTLPTSPITSMTYTRYTPWTSYQLVYQLATPTVEPITSEGQLTFIEGDNQIEIGTGIVLREIAPITKNPPIAAAMNDASYPSKYKVKKFIRAYKNSKYDPAWYASTLNSYGLEKARINWAEFEESAAYSVTYLMLDTSPVEPFVGSIAETEKALFTDLVQDVQQATARLSIVESKKAEKDSPAWITPTLLNGWNGSGIGYRIEGTRVFLKGSLLNGSVTSGTTLFIMPISLRAKSNTTFTLGQYSTATVETSVAIVDILADGRVVLARAEHNVICFQGQSYSID